MRERDALRVGVEEDAQRGDGVLFGEEAGQQRHDHPPVVQPHQPADRLQRATDRGQHAVVDAGAGEGRQRPHDHRRDQDQRAGLLDEADGVVPHVEPHGAAVGHVVERQLHDERGLVAAERELVHDDPRHGQDGQIERHQPERDQGRPGHEEGRDQEREHRQPRRARHQRRQQDRQPAGAALFDDARAEHGRHVAAEAQEERHERLAVQPHQVHEAIHDVRAAGQIADILQRAEDGEEDDQDRQEGEHRAHAVDQAVGDQPEEPCRRPAQRERRQRIQRAQHLGRQPVGDGGRDRVGEPESHAEKPQQERQPGDRMRRHAIDPLGEGDGARLRLRDRRAHHAADPLVAPAGDVQVGILMLQQQSIQALPILRRQRRVHHRRDLGVAFEQLERHPILRVGRRGVIGDEAAHGSEHRLVLGADGWPVGRVGVRRLGHLDRGVGQLLHALVPGRHHRHHRDAERRLQHVRLDVDAVLLGDVEHVQPQHHRLLHRQQFRHQIEVALQCRGVDHGDDDVGPLADQVVARDPLFLRVGGQAVGARQIHQVEAEAVLAAEGAGLLLHRLARPVADVLAQAGEHVEDGGLAHVGLADEGHRELPGGRDGGRVPGVMACRRDELEDGLGRLAWRISDHDSPAETSTLAASVRPSATNAPRNDTSIGPRP